MYVYPVDSGTNKVEWMAEVLDLPGCVGAGDTPQEAVDTALDAIDAWIEAAIRDSRIIPKPNQW